MEDVTFKNKKGENLAGILHPQKSDKGIILSHCFTCSKHHPVMKKLSIALNNAGYSTLRFDMSGNGESQGKFENSTYSKQKDDLMSAIEFMKSRKVKNIGLVGHSMGAAASMLCHSNKNVNSICVLGAQADTSNIQEHMKQNQLDEISKKGRTKITVFHRKYTIDHNFIRDARQQHIDKLIPNIEQPLCIIHGNKDKIVSCKNAEKIYELATGKRQLYIIKQGDHFFSKHFRSVENLVIDWFRDTL